MQIDKVERFETFVLLIDAVHKGINKIKLDILPDSAIKGVHTMWLYELLQNPNGLTAAEIAAKTKIDRSLVSRELRILMKEGIVVTDSKSDKRSYNSVINLTPKGVAYAQKIADAAMEIQNAVSSDIPIDELATFYLVLEKLYENINIAAGETSADKTDKEF